MKILALAAGKGRRMWPYTEEVNKCMISVEDKPLLFHNLRQCIMAMPNCSEIVIVVGYRREQVESYFGANFSGIPVKYIWQKHLDGIAGAVALAAHAIQTEPFLLTLGDELLWRPNLSEMIANFLYTNVDGICGVLQGRTIPEIQENYTLQLNSEGFITQLVEKPSVPYNNLLGLGYCLFRPSALTYVEKTPMNPARNQRDLCDWINICIKNGLRFRTYPAGEDSINLNNYQSLEQLKKMGKATQEEKDEEG